MITDMIPNPASIFKKDDSAENKHVAYVKDLTTQTLQAIASDLRHNSTLWARSRRIAALDELERRNQLK